MHIHLMTAGTHLATMVFSATLPIETASDATHHMRSSQLLDGGEPGRRHAAQQLAGWSACVTRRQLVPHDTVLARHPEPRLPEEHALHKSGRNVAWVLVTAADSAN